MIINLIIALTFALQDILKYTERAGLDAGPLRRAYQVMCVVPKETNDMMQFGRLQGYTVCTVQYVCKQLTNNYIKLQLDISN